MGLQRRKVIPMGHKEVLGRVDRAEILRNQGLARDEVPDTDIVTGFNPTASPAYKSRFWAENFGQNLPAERRKFLIVCEQRNRKWHGANTTVLPMGIRLAQIWGYVLPKFKYWAANLSNPAGCNLAYTWVAFNLRMGAAVLELESWNRRDSPYRIAFQGDTS